MSRTILMACAIAFLAFTNVSTAAENPKVVKVAIRKAFVPVGFDSNDRSEVLITGVFPDTCYKMGENRAIVNQETQTITIEQEAVVFESLCMDMIVPFTQVVKIGMVGRGDYKIVDGASGESLGKLEVAQGSSSTVDDYLYLPVTNAYVEELTNPHGHSLALVGNYADRCTKFKEAQVHYYPDVIVVQPIAERVESNRCSEDFNRFSVKVPLKYGLRGVQMIHIRSMGGQSFNTLFDFEH